MIWLTCIAGTTSSPAPIEDDQAMAVAEPAGMRHSEVGAPKESTTTNASPVVALGAEAADGDDVAEPVDRALRLSVRVVAQHAVDGPRRADHEQVVAAHREATEHGVAFRHQRVPTHPTAVRFERRPHDTTLRARRAS